MIIVIIINLYHYLHITFKIKSRISFKVETPGYNLQYLTVNFNSYLLINNLNLIISPDLNNKFPLTPFLNLEVF